MEKSGSFISSYVSVYGEKYQYISEDQLLSLIDSLFDKSVPVNEILLKVVLHDCSIDFNIKLFKRLVTLRGRVKNNARYTARLIESSSGKSYAVEFRSPLILDGDQGKKFKKGLGTDLPTAQFILEELNILLANPDFWSKDGMTEAQKLFMSKTVYIFYDKVEF